MHNKNICKDAQKKKRQTTKGLPTSEYRYIYVNMWLWCARVCVGVCVACICGFLFGFVARRLSAKLSVLRESQLQLVTSALGSCFVDVVVMNDAAFGRVFCVSEWHHLQDTNISSNNGNKHTKQLKRKVTLMDCPGRQELVCYVCDGRELCQLRAKELKLPLLLLRRITFDWVRINSNQIKGAVPKTNVDHLNELLSV